MNAGGGTGKAAGAAARAHARGADGGGARAHAGGTKVVEAGPGESPLPVATSPPLLVSACLAGLATTHAGTAKPSPKVMELVLQGRAILVCPEQLGGLPTPRPCAEIVAGGDSPDGGGAEVLAGRARVLDVNGNDVTANYLRGAREALKAARLSGCTTAILKARSPSCGKDQIHDGTFSGVLVPGSGVTAALLAGEGIKILSEEGLEGRDL
ncbi:MAG: hypothetical protein NVSMB32_01080 [Actinomycetota bacterium]